MKVRLINNKKITGTSNKFNTCSYNEILMYFNDGGASSELISDIEVEIKDEWISLSDAFKTKLLITDNYNTEFFEPVIDEEKEKGYRL